jgi:hypothetical protein
MMPLTEPAKALVVKQAGAEDSAATAEEPTALTSVPRGPVQASMEAEAAKF